jgi:hypothetical protein
MKHHITRVLIASTLLVLPAAAGAQTQGATASVRGGIAGPVTADGRPDLQGTWSFATLTPMERPKEFGTKAVLTPEEARQYAEESRKRRNMDQRSGGGAADVERAYNDFWWDFGTTASLRTSLIIDPPDGRRPAYTPEAQKRMATQFAGLKRPAEGPEDRMLAERCIVGFNAGPPMTPSAYNNNVQIVQTKDNVLLLNEMVHDARVVPLDGRPRPVLTRWMGESRGRWEGDTLVVETINFKGPTSFGGSSEKMKLTERFRLDGPNTLLYQFTVEDPTTWTRPWTVEIPMARSSEPIFEYACHEGNIGMEGILKGARADEQRAAAPTGGVQ